MSCARFFQGVALAMVLRMFKLFFHWILVSKLECSLTNSQKQNKYPQLFADWPCDVTWLGVSFAFFLKKSKMPSHKETKGGRLNERRLLLTGVVSIKVKMFCSAANCAPKRKVNGLTRASFGPLNEMRTMPTDKKNISPSSQSTRKLKFHQNSPNKFSQFFFYLKKLEISWKFLLFWRKWWTPPHGPRSKDAAHLGRFWALWWHFNIFPV